MFLCKRKKRFFIKINFESHQINNKSMISNTKLRKQSAGSFMIFFENYIDMKMRMIENYLANIPLQNYESISHAIWSKKVQILTTKSGSVSQSSSSASFTIAFGSYPAFHISLKQKEGNVSLIGRWKQLKRTESLPGPLPSKDHVMFCLYNRWLFTSLYQLSFWTSLNAGILTTASPGILSLPSERNEFLSGAGLWKPSSSV